MNARSAVSSARLFDSYLTPKARVGHSRIAGKGIIAVEPIAGGEVVAVWGGHLITWGEVEELPPEIEEHPVQVWHGLFLGPRTPEEIEDVDYMNHSCEPTCGVRGQNIVVARRDISPGEELTFDYATTDTVGLDFQCHCGVPTCRGHVTSDDWKNPEFRQKHAGFLSLYIQEMVDASLQSPLAPRQAQGERSMIPLVVSLSNHERSGAAAGGNSDLPQAEACGMEPQALAWGVAHQEARLWPTA